MFGLLPVQLYIYAMLVLALYVFAWWVAAFIEFIDIFLVNFTCIYHVFYDLPLDLAQGFFLAVPSWAKIIIVSLLIFIMPGTGAFPFLALILAFILAVNVADYAMLIINPKRHRKWCTIRKACHYKHLAKRIKRMTFMFATVYSKTPKPS